MVNRRGKIPPRVADIMFSLWTAGFPYTEIQKHMAAQGMDFKTKTIEALSKRANWKERKQAIVDATKEYYDDILKVSKKKQIQAYALATNALCDQIMADYLAQKSNPEAFAAEIEAGTRPKPIWMIHTSKDAQVLLETQYMLISDFKKTPETQVSIQNNTVEIQQILSEDDRRSLLRLLADAKEKTFLGEITPEAEVEKIPEKCK